jgi:N-dimethylarginine dimethylaminohydrolase
MINARLLVSDADYFANDAKINPYYANEIIDIEKAKREHATIVDCFKQAGIKVTQVKPPENCQDGVYTANWALVRNGVAVMSRLPAARAAEEPYAKRVLTELSIRCIIPLESLLFSGQGDSLVCGNFLFAGSGYRSDAAAQKFAAEALNLDLIQLRTIPQLKNGEPYINPATRHADSFFYDLDLALAIIDENTIAYAPAAFVESSRELLASLPLNKILVDLDEAKTGFACNLVSTGKTVIMSAHAPNLKHALESRGLTVLTPEISELKKGGGYIRCISLTLT